MTQRCIALLLGCFLVYNTSWAQPSGARGDNFIYRVIAGDTLSNIADTYTGQSQNWSLLQSLNHISNTLAVPIGKELAIPFRLIPTSPAALSITHRAGQIQVNGQALRADAHTLNEGDHIQTGNQSYLTLSMQDNSTLLVPENSSITLQRARSFDRAKLTDTIIALQDGDVESIVAPDSTGVGRFEVHTPVSITGVRGTSLRVRQQGQASFSEVLEGRAELSTTTSEQLTNIPSRYGAAVSADGQVSNVTLLPKAPVISEPIRQGGQWSTQVQSVPEIESYLVQVALDPQGSKLVSRHVQRGPTLTFSARRPGPHFVLIRAVDLLGLSGPDTIASFTGAFALTSSDGTPITTSYGEPVLLRDF